MFRYFKTFFYPYSSIYSYRQSKETVLHTIDEVVSRKLTLLGNNDIEGRVLNGDAFVLDIVSPVYTLGIKFGSTLVGQVIGSENGATIVRTKAKPSAFMYFLFGISIVFGIAYLYSLIPYNQKYLQTVLNPYP